MVFQKNYKLLFSIDPCLDLMNDVSHLPWIYSAEALVNIMRKMLAYTGNKCFKACQMDDKGLITPPVRTQRSVKLALWIILICLFYLWHSMILLNLSSKQADIKTLLRIWRFLNELIHRHICIDITLIIFNIMLIFIKVSSIHFTLLHCIQASRKV